MFGIHLDGESMNVLEAVKAGFTAWGLLICALGIIFVSIVVLAKLTGKKKKNKEEDV